MIERMEEIRAKLQILFFKGGKVLRRREIYIRVARPDQIIAPLIA
jgi:hypothetical protein